MILIIFAESAFPSGRNFQIVRNFRSDFRPEFKSETVKFFAVDAVSAAAFFGSIAFKCHIIADFKTAQRFHRAAGGNGIIAQKLNIVSDNNASLCVNHNRTGILTLGVFLF